MRQTLAFDVYGTLIDTQGIAATLKGWMGERATVLARAWREKQLEYTFRRGLRGRTRISIPAPSRRCGTAARRWVSRSHRGRRRSCCGAIDSSRPSPMPARPAYCAKWWETIPRRSSGRHVETNRGLPSGSGRRLGWFLQRVAEFEVDHQLIGQGLQVVLQVIQVQAFGDPQAGLRAEHRLAGH